MIRKARTHVMFPVLALFAAGATNASELQSTAGEVQANGITIAYQATGPAHGEAVLIIAGLGGQMADSEGPDPFAAEFARRGYRAIVFDNRDAGKSTRFDSAGNPPSQEELIAALNAGKPAPVAYTLADMAADAVGLLDALDVEKAHVVGGSMGGIIGQLVAAGYPDRVLSFTALISTSANPQIPYGPAIATLAELYKADSAADSLDLRVSMFKAISGSSSTIDEAKLRERFKRAPRCQPCVARQSAASTAATTPFAAHVAKLHAIEVPTVVIGGAEDPLLPPAHSRDLAASIPDAELRIMPGMGHDLPPVLIPTIVDIVVANAARGRTAESK